MNDFTTFGKQGCRHYSSVKVIRFKKKNKNKKTRRYEINLWTLNTTNVSKTFASMSFLDKQHSGIGNISAKTCLNSSTEKTSVIYHFSTMCYGYRLSLWQQEPGKGATVFLESKQDTFHCSLNKSVVKLLRHYIIIWKRTFEAQHNFLNISNKSSKTVLKNINAVQEEHKKSDGCQTHALPLT